jgi:hypothetical protein
MTEDNAKTKWCPMAKDKGPPLHDLYNPYEVMCIGSECMVWRWEKPNELLGDGLSMYGYCGLAGKP